MLLSDWISSLAEGTHEADLKAAEILDIKVRTVRAMRLGHMNPSPKVAFRISNIIDDVSFRECFSGLE